MNSPQQVKSSGPVCWNYFAGPSLRVPNCQKNELKSLMLSIWTANCAWHAANLSFPAACLPQPTSAKAQEPVDIRTRSPGCPTFGMSLAFFSHLALLHDQATCLEACHELSCSLSPLAVAIACAGLGNSLGGRFNQRPERRTNNLVLRCFETSMANLHILSSCTPSSQQQLKISPVLSLADFASLARIMGQKACACCLKRPLAEYTGHFHY